jgi:lipopolysaccharide/colanic/teichoic acid biosynthesis glycosyltransferase
MFDLVVAGAGVLLGLPVFALAAVAIKWETPGPVFFRQERVGRGGQTFRIHKFRTMVDGATSHGPALTTGADPRITRTGRFLRRTKLDELPQLIDVLCGQMSLVGPRPELPQYVARYPEALRKQVLALRPGITDPASLEFSDESGLLAQAPDPEREYVEVILPRKLGAAAAYAESATLGTDMKVIAATVWLVLRRLATRSPGP